MHHSLIAFLSTALFAMPAANADWLIDPTHSRARFTVQYANIVPVAGWFCDMRGKLNNFNGTDPSTANIEITINANSIDTGDPMRDMHLRRTGFFEVEKYPQITFKSKSIRRTGPKSFSVIGDLTMHGITKQVTLTGSGPSKSFVDASSGEKVIAATATTKLNRKDYKIDWNRDLAPGVKMVGDEVEISLEVVAIERAKRNRK